jgi:hypothetical protein
MPSANLENPPLGLKDKNAIQGIVPKRQQALLLLVRAKER